MSLHALRRGQHVKVAGNDFLILQRLAGQRWQLQNTTTGEYCTFTEDDLLDRFVQNELSFVQDTAESTPCTDRLAAKLAPNLSTYASELIALAANRVQYLKEVDRQQPIAITPKTLEPLIRSVSERIKDPKPPSWLTVWRDYGKWLGAGRDIRAIILRHGDRGKRGTRMLPEVQTISDQVIQDMYMTAERKKVPEVRSEILRRISDSNKLRPQNDQLPIPSRSTIYRRIARKSPYDVMVARYGKRRAEMEFRVSSTGPLVFRALQRVSMDHTPSDIIVVDDNSMLPLGRPTITSALDEYTRCPMGFHAGFEPPSCLSVMRCLKHAMLPKTYVHREFPEIKNRWECYGVPELIVVDNPPEFHSSHFERACLQIGADIQYAKVLVPWYKGKLERFQGTMNHDLVHGNPGTTFSNILERDYYDPARHAVVLLSTLREMIHRWIIDIYLQTPHRGIKDTPAHRWSEIVELPPPLPPHAAELDIVLGMTVQRVVFHYGLEMECLRYNSPELGELRRRLGATVKVELTFDPGNLGHVNVLDPMTGTYTRVPAVDQSYANGLTLWQHKVIRRYAQRELNGRTDPIALAQAKAEIRTLVDRDLNRKSTRLHHRHARFSQGQVAAAISQPLSSDMGSSIASESSGMNQSDMFVDELDGDLPVFEAALDLPRPATADYLIPAGCREHDRKRMN